jgi:hypothetical protein
LGIVLLRLNQGPLEPTPTPSNTPIPETPTFTPTPLPSAT